MYIKLYNNRFKKNGVKVPLYNFTLQYKINLIQGESGCGKSYFIDNVQRAIADRNGWSIESDVGRVSVVTSVSDLQALKNTDVSVIVMDEELASELRRKRLEKTIYKYNKYFIIVDRGTNFKMDINVNAIFKIKANNEVVIEGLREYKFERLMQRVDMNDTDSIKTLVAEDGASGLTFWKSAMRNIHVIDIGIYGNGNMLANVIYALNNYNGNCLVTLDYDCGSNIMYGILSDTRVDLNRIRFLKIECFEELICNSDFIISKYPEIKDKVINYMNYMDCSYNSTGQYFSKLLYDTVKVRSPIKGDNARNKMKFYEKDMKNFVECFIKDCCSYDKNDCTLKYDGNKVEAMLDNKFRFLRQFI